jgi:hypothetical protein
LRKVRGVGIGEALRALEADALLGDRRTVVFLDELQELREWDRDGDLVQREIAAAARRPSRRLVFAFAGSETTLLQSMFVAGQPLHLLPDRYPLPAISNDAWRKGLQERFVRGGVIASETTLSSLIDASGGQPFCTMYAAKSSYASAAEEGAATLDDAHVAAGLARARAQPWWKELGGR